MAGRAGVDFTLGAGSEETFSVGIYLLKTAVWLMCRVLHSVCGVTERPGSVLLQCVVFADFLKLWPFCEMTDLECKYGKFFSVIWEDVKYYEGKVSIGESHPGAKPFQEIQNKSSR